MSQALLESFYEALRRGDRAAVAGMLDPSFVARFAAGLGYGVGGVHRGEAAIDAGWWTLGREYRVAAEIEQYIDCADGRMLVVGRYRGRHRRSGREFEARFTHLWSFAGGKLASLEQLTDTARWPAD